MKRLLLLSSAALCLGMTLYDDQQFLTHPGREHVVINIAEPDTRLSKGVWELGLNYVAMGQDEEGIHGVLYYGKKGSRAYFKRQPGQTNVTTTLGTLTYVRDWEDRTRLSDISGWVPPHLQGYYPSWRRRGRQNTPPQGMPRSARQP
jgi:hypothetical protein